MDLNTVWFMLITVLFIGFFFLEGFDYGVGMLIPFVGKNDTERRMVLNTIGPVWDGNEVWLLTAGGAIFAAFPNWYATMFSGMYLALLLILLGLIVRGVAIEFRSKHDTAAWRGTWDKLLCVGSFLPAFLFGVAVTNLVAGMPIDAQMEYAGTFFDLLSPFTLVGGVAFTALFVYHGSLFLSLKSGIQTVSDRCAKVGRTSGLLTVLLVVVWVVFAALQTPLLQKPIALGATIVAALALIFSVIMQIKGKFGKAFVGTGLTIAVFTVSVFANMFPNVIPSTLDPDWSLTIYTASSSPYTLKIMTVVACIMVPIVLGYQIWTYWVFRRRMTQKDLHY